MTTVGQVLTTSDTGSLSKIGTQLISPETGWRRYLDTDSKLVYTGTWGTQSFGTPRVTEHFSNTSGATLKFKFYGTKLRLLVRYRAGQNNFTVTIDGVTTNSEAISGVQEDYTGIVIYENLWLPPGVHDVTITNLSTGTNNYTMLEAIDIDSVGYLFHHLESVLTLKYLIQDGNELKTISEGNLVTVCNTTDDNSIIASAFFTSGLDNLTSWNNSLTSQIVNNTFKVAIHRKYVE